MQWDAQPHPEPILQSAPRLVDARLLLVALAPSFAATVSFVAVDDELAIEAFEFGVGLAVNGETPFHRKSGWRGNAMPGASWRRELAPSGNIMSHCRKRARARRR